MRCGKHYQMRASVVLLGVVRLVCASCAICIVSTVGGAGASEIPARAAPSLHSPRTAPWVEHVREALPGETPARSPDLPHSAFSLRVASHEEKFLYEGYRQLNRRHYDRAMRNFSAAMKQNADSAEAYRGLALIYWQRDHDMQAAGVYFRIALSKPMVTPELNIDYANYLASLNQLDDSLEHLYKTLDRWPKARNVRSQIAVLYYQKKNQMKACQWANNALEHQDELQVGLLERVCGYA
jgi:tetratricopeptide (TPR) repeat protein